MTLKEITFHLLREVQRADVQFQIRQEKAWFDFDKWMNQQTAMDVTAGFKRVENLWVDAIAFNFEIVPLKIALWSRAKILVGWEKNPTMPFRLKQEKDSRQCVKVTVSVRRGQNKEYSSQTETDPELQHKPDEVDVIDFIK